MDLRQLGYVVAIAEAGGFTRAADRVGISQPSLSYAVKALENELGAVLFHRLGRTVRPTAAGEALLGPARQALRDAEVARAAVAAVAGLEAGRLDLVCLPTLAVDPMAGLVGRFRHAHPGVRVRIDEPEDVDAVADAVRSGASELGLTEILAPVAGASRTGRAGGAGQGGRTGGAGRGDPPAGERGGGARSAGRAGGSVHGNRDDQRAPGGRVGDLESIELDAHEFVAVLPPGLAAGTTEDEPLSLRTLAELPLVTTPKGTSTRRQIDEAFETAGLEPTLAVETDHREGIIAMVLAGAGVSIVPAPLAASSHLGDAVVRPLTPRIGRKIGLVRRAGPLSPAAQAFVGLAVPGTPARPSRPRARRRRPTTR